MTREPRTRFALLVAAAVCGVTATSAAQPAAPPTPPDATVEEPAATPATPSEADAPAADDTAASTTDPSDADAAASEPDSGIEGAAAVAPDTAPAEAPVTATATDDAAVAAEVASIQEELLAGTDEEPDITESLSLYGFMDFTYTNGLGGNTEGFDRFAVGHMNLYLSSSLGKRWRTLGEIRFTYLPHGVGSYNEAAEYERYDTTTADYSDVDRPVRWGTTIIERAWLEYGPHPLFNVRMGHFLTPYGIWNVDHGSPVIIGVRTPYVVGDQLFPKSQSGIQIHGAHLIAPFKLGYHLTLSNGRGPIDTHTDLDRNKGIGARLYARADTPLGGVVLGFSGYQGAYTDRDEATSFSSGTFEYIRPITAHYQEQSVGADLAWDWHGLAVQAEALLNDRVYPDDEYRPATSPADGGALGVEEDTRRYGAYAQAGYRISPLNLMPYAGIEYYETGIPGFGTSAEAWLGLNLRPIPRVVLKTQYTHAWFPDVAIEDYKALEMQAAWSF
jgi:hypothetical protein